jgi:hypothetical protein
LFGHKEAVIVIANSYGIFDARRTFQARQGILKQGAVHVRKIDKLLG